MINKMAVPLQLTWDCEMQLAGLDSNYQEAANHLIITQRDRVNAEIPGSSAPQRVASGLSLGHIMLLLYFPPTEVIHSIKTLTAWLIEPGGSMTHS